MSKRKTPPASQSNKKSTVVTFRLPNDVVEIVDRAAGVKGVKRGEELRDRVLEIYGAAESS